MYASVLTSTVGLQAQIVLPDNFPGNPPAPDAVALGQDQLFDPTFAAYVLVDGQWSRSTAVLTAPDRVGLAAHAVKGTNGYGAGVQEIRLYGGWDINHYTHYRTVTSFEFIDGWNPNGAAGFNWDAARGVLSEPIFDIVPALLGDEKPTLGSETLFGGYGEYGYQGVAPIGSDEFRRAGTSRIDLLGSQSPFAADHMFLMQFRAPSDPLAMSDHMMASAGSSFSPIWADDNGQLKVQGFITHATGSGFNVGDFALGIAAYELRTFLVPKTMPGDCDGDGDVDSTDFSGFSVCIGGPEGGVAAGCGCFDLNADTAVDMLDFASFQRVFGQ